MHIASDRPIELDILGRRSYSVGAELVERTTASVRVWAPKCNVVELHVFDAFDSKVETSEPPTVDSRACRMQLKMQRDGRGYHSALVENVRIRDRYAFRLDYGEKLYADPASRFQPNGPCGFSQFVDSQQFEWSDDAWPGVETLGQVLYEMHVGTFTGAGTWAAAAEELPELKRAGITVVEMMPIADFPGQFGWGYDGVSMFAPTRLYGTPDDLRRFVDRAHAIGLGVILDVVYNHFGNFGNYLGAFSDDYYTDRYKNEWASAINFDGEQSAPVREFFVENARYWIKEFHFDGFRYDATQCVYDSSPTHILAEATQAAREAAGKRRTYFVAENEPQDVVHLRSLQQRGSGLDALWNDDFHHSAMVRLTGKNPAYYSDFAGSVEELIAAVKYGFLYQGQRSQWQGKPRGTSTHGFPASAFVSFLQNHDQVANSATGERVTQHTSSGRYRAMAALWLLAPQTPLFFQGQEFGSSSPFLFFADFNETDGEMVAKGRLQFLQQFPELRLPEARKSVADPRRRETFERCLLNFAERDTNRELYLLHQDLLKLRREDSVFRRQRADLIDGVRLADDALALRYSSPDGDDRLVIVNFGGDLWLSPTPQPLLAPPTSCGWQLAWTSEQPKYGGGCTPGLETDTGWRVPAETAVVMTSVPISRAAPPEAGLRTHAECKTISL